MTEGIGKGQKIPISQQAPDTEWACGQQAGTRSFYGMLELDPVQHKHSETFLRCSALAAQDLSPAALSLRYSIWTWHHT